MPILGPQKSLRLHEMVLNRLQSKEKTTIKYKRPAKLIGRQKT